jgi:hypothetical protein
MFEVLAAWQPGYWIAAFSAVLILVLLAMLWVSRLKERRMRVAFLQEPPQNLKVQDPVLEAARQHLQQLQEQMHKSLGHLENTLSQERAEVLANAEAQKQFARDNRLPLTLFELYEGMRHFAKKSEEAQAADMEWHGRIGITKIDVLPLTSDEVGSKIQFKLGLRAYTLVGRHHFYSKTAFVELCLFEDIFTASFIARVKPDASGSALESEAVVAMRPGPWLADLLATRSRMDLRKAELEMRAKHRDIERLKQDFSFERP